MRLLQRIWIDIKRGENIELYLSILIAIVVITLNFFGNVPQGLLTSLTLFILGLLATSILKIRYRLVKLGSDFTLSTDHLCKEIESLNEALNKSGDGQVTAERFFHKRPDTPLPTLLREAKTLDMIGTSLLIDRSNIVRTNNGAIGVAVEERTRESSLCQMGFELIG